MNVAVVGLGLLAALIVIFLIVKSRRHYPQEEIDWEAHDLQITDEGGDLRVLAGGRSYLFGSTQRDEFLRLYSEAWSRVRLNFAPTAIDNETIEFSPAEQLNLRQRIALDWVYVYNVNDRRFKFLFWNVETGNRQDVWHAAEAKYGAESEKAIALAAHTLNISTEKFKVWLKRYEEFLRR